MSWTAAVSPGRATCSNPSGSYMKWHPPLSTQSSTPFPHGASSTQKPGHLVVVPTETTTLTESLKAIEKGARTNDGSVVLACLISCCSLCIIPVIWFNYGTCLIQAKIGCDDCKTADECRGTAITVTVVLAALSVACVITSGWLSGKSDRTFC